MRQEPTTHLPSLVAVHRVPRGTEKASIETRKAVAAVDVTVGAWGARCECRVLVGGWGLRT
jgi:hypothetical protein